MRNLLGRLNSRSSEELERIARFWGVPMSSSRGTTIGVLYRTMSDIRAVRSVVAQLDEQSLRLIQICIDADEGALKVSDFAARLEISDSDAETLVSRLFRNGLLARSSSEQVSESYFLPRELTIVFRRVQEEIAEGDVSAAPLSLRMQSMDIASLETAAASWGMNVVPGLRSKDDLQRYLNQNITQDKLQHTLRSLPENARKIWDVLQSRSLGRPLPYSITMRAAGLATANSTEIRDALETLESRLLVLHTWQDGLSRALYIPAEITTPQSTTANRRATTPAPVDLEDIRLTNPPHRHAVAWDLLTLLREVADGAAPIIVPGEEVSPTWVDRVRSRLWFGEDTGYAGFLFELGMSIGVLRAAPSASGAHGDRRAIQPVLAPGIRQWRARSFADQSARLRYSWLVDEDWIEARERGEIQVWGANWRAFRRKLLQHMSQVSTNDWVLTRDLAARLATEDPLLVASSMTVALSRAGEQSDNPEENRRRALAQLVQSELETALTWFGIVERGSVRRKGFAVRGSAFGREVAAHADEHVKDPPTSGPALAIDESGEILVRIPAPIHLWSLSAFADMQAHEHEPVFVLSSRSVGRAITAGFDIEQIETYLERASGQDVPKSLIESLRSWAKGYRRVRMRRALVLTPDPGTSVESVVALVQAAGLVAMHIPDATDQILALFPPGADEQAEEAFLTSLRAAGYLGQWEVQHNGNAAG